MSGDALDGLASPPVFIVGNARSGTTWTYDLLTTHPQVGGVFESWLFGRGTGLRGLFHHNQWDPEVIARAVAATGRPWGLNALGTREEMVAEVRALAGRWFSRVLEPGHRHLVEKTPDHLWSMDVIAEVFPQARFVHVLRDPRAVAASLRAAAAWNAGWAGRGRTGAIARAAAEWAAEVPAGRAAGARLGDRYTEVRYEALKADPGAELGRLWAFCGIPATAEQVAASVAANDFATRHGGGGGDSAFRRRGRADGWRSELALLDRLALERSAGAAMRDAGYSAPRLWWLRPRRGDA